MKKLTILITILAIMFSITGCKGILAVSNQKQLTQKQKLDDFEYMYTILKDNYPYFGVNERLNGKDWLAEKDKYISLIKLTKDDESFFNALQSILSNLKNGHTDMLDKKFYFYAKSAYQKNSTENKAWLDQLNNPKALARYSSMPDSKNNIIPSANEVISNNVHTEILEEGKVAYLSIGLFNTFNINEDMKTIGPFLKDIKNYKALIIDIRGNGGGNSAYWSDYLVPMLTNKPFYDTQYDVFRGGNFVEQFVNDKFKCGYKGFIPISKIDGENLKNMPPELKEEFKYYSKTTTSIKPHNSVGFNGKIYLLIDGGVFSAADNFASFAKNAGFATLVGERTAGDGLGFDPAVCVLPNSGYVFRFPLLMGLTSDGTCDFEYKTKPDITVSSKKSSDISDDEAVQAVMKLIN